MARHDVIGDFVSITDLLTRLQSNLAIFGPKYKNPAKKLLFHSREKTKVLGSNYFILCYLFILIQAPG